MRDAKQYHQEEFNLSMRAAAAEFISICPPDLLDRSETRASFESGEDIHRIYESFLIDCLFLFAIEQNELLDELMRKVDCLESTVKRLQMDTKSWKI